MANYQFKRLILALCLVACLSCEQNETVPGKLWADATVLHDGYKQTALTDLRELHQSVLQFLAEPDNAEHLITAQNAWRKAHTSFLQAKFLIRPQMSELDTWPIEPGYLDVLPAYPESGIISDLTLEITAAGLRHQHQFTDPTEAALGFHVIEFFVFSRPSTDFLVSEDPKVERRRRILELITALLVEDLSLKLRKPIVIPKSTEEQLHQLMTLLEHSVSHLYGESLQLVVDPHSRFAGQSRNNLLTQLKIIEQLIFSPVNLGSTLIQLNDILTRDITHTVREIIALLESDGSDTEISERCSQLLNGLDHQLRSFTSQLTPEIN